MKQFAIFLDGEECKAYGRFEASNADEAIDTAIQKLAKGCDPSETLWRFEPDYEENFIDMYYADTYQNTVAVRQVVGTWYAVQKDSEDNDWRTGSTDYGEAVKMAKQYGPEARIAVIREGDEPLCIMEIPSEDF